MFGRLKEKLLGRRGTGRTDLDGILAQLGPRDVAIDCGANVGDITAAMAAGGGEVHAFEPNPYAFEKLKHRFSRTPHVHCHQAAVALEDGVAPLYLHARAAEDQVLWSTGSSLERRKVNIDTAQAVEVRTIHLGRFLKELGRPVRLLKMDIEGAEVDVLPPLVANGALDAIEWVLVEVHDAKNPELKPATDALRRTVSERGLTNVRFDWI